MLSDYLFDIIILLIAAVIAVPLSQAARLGAVPGFLFAGIVVGPSALGLVTNTSEIANLAEIGVVLLLFVIGMELKPARIWSMKRYVFGLGSAQVVITGIVIGAISHLLFAIPMKVSILIGPVLALSSTAFVLQLISEQKKLETSYGQTSIAVLLLQDLAVVPLLILVPLLASPDLSISGNIGFALAESMLILLLLVVLGRFFLHPLLHQVALSGNSEVFTASAVLIVLGTAYATEHAGLSMAMGAFLAGLLISDSFYRHQVLAEIQPFRGLLLGLFFMSMGMSLDLTFLFENFTGTLSLVVLLIVVKIIVLFPLALLFKLDSKSSTAVAMVLAQSGEFALVVFTLAFHSDLLTENLFQQLLMVVLISMLLTPALAKLAMYFLNKRDTAGDAESGLTTDAPIVIIGFGRVGHRIGEILSVAGIPFVAIDHDASVVAKERARGHPVFFGNAHNLDIAELADGGEARMIVISLNEPAATQDLVRSLRVHYPADNIYVRGHSQNECRRLLELGATDVVSENVEASLELARLVLGHTSLYEDKRAEIISNFRQSYYSQIHK